MSGSKIQFKNKYNIYLSTPGACDKEYVRIIDKLLTDAGATVTLPRDSYGNRAILDANEYDYMILVPPQFNSFNNEIKQSWVKGNFPVGALQSRDVKEWIDTYDEGNNIGIITNRVRDLIDLNLLPVYDMEYMGSSRNYNTNTYYSVIETNEIDDWNILTFLNEEHAEGLHTWKPGMINTKGIPKIESIVPMLAASLFI